MIGICSYISGNVPVVFNKKMIGKTCGYDGVGVGDGGLLGCHIMLQIDDKIAEDSIIF